MRREYSLSLTKNYISNWTFVEGIRELIQNALDAVVQGDSSDSIFSYDELAQKLFIRSVGAKLEPRTLLLGLTSKADNTKTIGQFGEGYKLALLVLTRENKTVTIYNNALNEIWTARFSKSRIFGEEILKVTAETADTLFTKKRENDTDLVWVIDNISIEDYEACKKMYLGFSNYKVSYTGEKADILDMSVKGNIYVSGLYVTNLEDLTYSYNFKSETLILGRDRDKIKDFDLLWELASVWVYLDHTKESRKLLLGLICDGKTDVRYALNILTSNKIELLDGLAQTLTVRHGGNVLYATADTEIKSKSDKKIVILSTGMFTTLKDYGVDLPFYEDAVEVDNDTTSNANLIHEVRQDLAQFIIDYRSTLSPDCLASILNIYNKVIR